MIELLEKYPASTDNLESIENLISQAPDDSGSYYEMLSSAASNPGITAEKLEYFADVTTSISPENADGFKNTLKNLASLDLTPEAIQEISSISDQIDDKDIELLAAQDIQGIVSDIALLKGDNDELLFDAEDISQFIALGASAVSTDREALQSITTLATDPDLNFDADQIKDYLRNVAKNGPKSDIDIDVANTLRLSFLDETDPDFVARFTGSSADGRNFENIADPYVFTLSTSEDRDGDNSNGIQLYISYIQKGVTDPELQGYSADEGYDSYQKFIPISVIRAYAAVGLPLLTWTGNCSRKIVKQVGTTSRSVSPAVQVLSS